jgi:hypothetical protein
MAYCSPEADSDLSEEYLKQLCFAFQRERSAQKVVYEPKRFVLNP